MKNLLVGGNGNGLGRVNNALDIGALYLAGFVLQKVRLPQSRMWRRHPLPHRAGVFTL